MLYFIRACALILSLLALFGCGGGGGGGGSDGDGGSSVGTMSLSTNALTFNAPYTTTPPSQTITAAFTGVRNGTLYMKVVAAGPAVASITNIAVTGTTSGQATINPVPASSLSPGTYTSTVTVYACTSNPDCTSSQLAGSPQTVNVTYTIPGVSTSLSSLNYSVGDSPVAADLTRQFEVTSHPEQSWHEHVDVPWLSVSLVNNNTKTVTRISASLIKERIDLMFGGTYTGTLTLRPVFVGSVSPITIPITLTITRGPYLKPGFPVQTYATSGTYQTGPASVYITVGNMDSSPEPEILVSGHADGPLWAFKHDGTLLNGWPEQHGLGFGYPSLGNFAGDSGKLEVATGYGPFLGSRNYERFVFGGDGQPLPGWPRESYNAGSITPPQIADVDDDGVDEIFFSSDAFRANGQPLQGWPAPNHPSGHLAFGDVDGDSVDEAIFATHSEVTAYEFDGSIVPGFPFQAFSFYDRTKSPVGPIVAVDMDGNGRSEILEVRKLNASPSKIFVRLFGTNGQMKWEQETLSGDSVGYTTAPALADLDGDDQPEIIVQVDKALYVWHGDGTLMQGWPARLGERGYMGSSAPVVGDVDGDQLPDIVITTGDGDNGKVWIFNRNGQLHPSFPKELPLSDGMVPAIADIDLDGRNEIIVGSTLWTGFSGMYDTVFAFDLNGTASGPILWGQVGGGPRHQYRYPPK